MMYGVMINIMKGWGHNSKIANRKKCVCGGGGIKDDKVWVY